MAVFLTPGPIALPTLELGEPVALKSPNAEPVQTWPDPSGHIRAAAYRVGSAYWVDWPGVGRFVLSAAPAVRAVPDKAAGAGAVHDIFRRFITPLAWQLRGGEALHASALCWGRSTVGFCASTGTGKSTFACGLALRGHALLTDDGLLLDPSEVPALVRPTSAGLRLRSESAAHFARPRERDGRAVGLPDAAPAAEGLLAGLVVLERAMDPAAPDILRLQGGDALAAVLAHAHSIDAIDVRVRTRSVERYLAILEDTPVWRLHYPSGYDRLPEALDLVERTVEAIL